MTKGSFPVICSFKCLEDNVGVLLHDPDSGTTISIDAPDETAILDSLYGFGWGLDYICVTHHHWDHVAGVFPLKKRFGCRVIGPSGETSLINGLDDLVMGNARIQLGGIAFEIIDLPGHTSGQVGYGILVEGSVGIVFVGDALFEMGCGRLFEGSPSDMWTSLKKLRSLPDDAVVYYGHDYGLKNCKFALSLEPDRKDLLTDLADMESNKAFRPNTTIGKEKRTNPFMRADCEEVMDAVGLSGMAPELVFAELRRRRDSF